MVIGPKQDGSPRRCIDYQDSRSKQTHTKADTSHIHTKPPWQIASLVPGNNYKNVLDCWQGYHSIPLHPDDRHVTTFLTEFGRYRYKTSPQGLKPVGDAYTHRTDLIIGDFPNHAKIVDDSLLWTTDIEKNFFRTCELLTKCSAQGVIFNPKKIQFSSLEVNFAGFLITATGIQPPPSFLENIRIFPTPKNLRDVRSWFRAVNQISYAFASTPAMLPFR